MKAQMMQYNVDRKTALSENLKRNFDLPEGEVGDHVKAFLSRPFDLEQGPLLRCQVLVKGWQEHLVLVNMPADVTGGWRSALGSHADGSVLVVTGKESPADLGAAAAILTDVGAPVVGFVAGGEASGRRFRR